MTATTPHAVHVTTPSDLEVRVTRVFDAPRRLVYKAHTTPELVKRWMNGPNGWELHVCEIDARAGGRYRYEMRRTGPAEKGWEDAPAEMGWGGTFREVVPNERIVHTELFDADWTGGETVVTIVFRDLPNGRSELEMTVLYVSKEARDGAVATGMTTGMEMAYTGLDALLASGDVT